MAHSGPLTYKVKLYFLVVGTSVYIPNVSIAFASAYRIRKYWYMYDPNAFKRYQMLYTQVDICVHMRRQMQESIQAWVCRHAYVCA